MYADKDNSERKITTMGIITQIKIYDHRNYDMQNKSMTKKIRF